MPLPPELYIEKPTRGFKWDTLHNMIVIVLLLHVAAFLFLGYMIPGLPVPAMIVYDIGLVKGAGRKGGARKRSMENGQKKKVSKKEKQVKVTKSTSVKKKKTSNVVALKAMLPQDNYAKHRQVRENRNKGNQGAITSGKRPGSGGKGEQGAGRSDSGKGKGGSGYGVLIGYPYNLLPQRYDSDSLLEERRKYFNSTRSRPLLVRAPMPGKNSLRGMGYSKVKVKLLISEVENFPNTGIRPDSVVIIDIETKKTGRIDAHREIVMDMLNNSSWYPARREGKVIQEYITFFVYVYGTDDG
ncbi:MAG: hypothetical protein K8T10_12625 [Candidatus Eremiobacteraeota bacterium]|nr:hypothetical protein [Candidatus Eremiobacteraeota bacterium]